MAGANLAIRSVALGARSRYSGDLCAHARGICRWEQRPDVRPVLVGDLHDVATGGVDPRNDRAECVWDDEVDLRKLGARDLEEPLGERIEALPARRGHEHRIRVPPRECGALHVAEHVALVQHHEPRHFRRADFAEHLLDGVRLLCCEPIVGARVRDVEHETRVLHFVERRTERSDELVRIGAPEASVLGRLADPLHAGNLGRVAERVADEPDLLVVAVDAAIGPQSLVGSIRVRNGAITPGRGVGKSLLPVGELAVSAVVGCASGDDAQIALQSARLYVVNSLAELISGALWTALSSLRRPERDRRFTRAASSPGGHEAHDAYDVAHRQHADKLPLIEHDDMAHAVFHHQGRRFVD